MQNNVPFEEKDTVEIYQKIKVAAEKHKFTKAIYEAVFVDPSGIKPEEIKPTTPTAKKRVNPYKLYKHAIIRNIRVVVLDPFGYSVNDTNYHPGNSWQAWGNRVHKTTNKRIIRNNLLFKKYDELDPLSISESERVLRLLPYVNDARIYIEKPRRKKTDSVDITVYVHDKWSLGGNITGNVDILNTSLSDFNILGMGQRLEQSAAFDIRNKYIIWSGNHSVYNIQKSFIASNIFYTSSPLYKQIRLNLDRPFYSPLAKWAGGVNINQVWSNLILYTPETGNNIYKVSFTQQDVWAAKSIKFSRVQNLFNQSSSVIVGARVFHTTYSERPSRLIDLNQMYLNNTLVLGSLGLTIRQYYKEKYLFRFGANEDVPEGTLLQGLAGVQYKEFNLPDYYLGFKVAKGRHYDYLHGYFSSSFAYGTFFNKNHVRSGTINAEAFYFSDLIQKGNWFMRQFASFNIVYGIKKQPGETLLLKPEQLNGFNSSTLIGTSKMILNLQSVFYLPYHAGGFRFAPVLLAGVGMVGTQDQSLISSQIYQAYSLGLLIRNENLLINTFEVSIGLYPYIPGQGHGIFKTNPISSFNLRIKDYAISKPETVSYE